MVDRLCELSKVSILGAGNVGATLAQQVVQKNLADVVLLDIEEGKPQGIALDLMEARSIERHDRSITGTNRYRDTARSQVVVVTAGAPRKPGMSRDDLLRINAAIVHEVVSRAVEYSPDALLLVVTNPLDAMTYLAWKTSGFVPERVLGMAGVLDAARFETFIAWELGVSVKNITALVLGGHGDLMVPLPRFATVAGVPIVNLMNTEQIERLIKRTREGGSEVVRLLKTGSAYYAPAAAVTQMIEAILRDEQRILPAAVYLDGAYQLHDIFMGVPIKLGRNGVESVLELELEPAEKAALLQSAASVSLSLDLLAQSGLFSRSRRSDSF